MKSKVLSSRTLNPVARKTQILDAARSLLVEKGYSELVLDDVAHRAGVAKGTLYLYFADKKEIYDAVMEEIVDGLDERVREASKGKAEPMAGLSAAVSAMLSYVDDNKDFFLMCGQFSPKQRSTVVQKRFERYVENLEGVIGKAVKAGKLRRHDPKTGSLMLIALTRMFMMKKVFFGRNLPLAASSAELMDLFVNGLGLRKLL